MNRRLIGGIPRGWRRIGIETVQDHAWNPLKIPGLQAWYDATQNLYTDTAKTTEAVNTNDRVAVWLDLSGNGRDLIRTTDDTWRPILRNNVYKLQHRRTVRLTGGIHAMVTSATWQHFPSKRGSIYIVMFGRGDPLGSGRLAWNAGGANSLWMYNNTTGATKFYDTADRMATTADSRLGLQVHSIIRSGNTTINYYRDGVLDANVVCNNIQYDIGPLKLSNPAVNGMNADVCEIIELDHASDDIERIQIETYLMNKWLDTPRTPVWTRQGNVLVATLPAEDSNLYEATLLYEGSPQILADPLVFKIWYTSGWTNPPELNYAESADGINFTKLPGNPIISPGARSCIVKNGASYWLYSTTGGGYPIRLHTSADGVNFVLDTASCLNAGEAWCDAVHNMHVWKEGPGDWRMLYDGKLAADNHYSIGYATSVDGKTFVPYVGNPVIINGGGPCCIKIGTTYWLWQHHWIEADDTLPTDGFRWKSTDCINWVKDPLHFPTLSRIAVDEGVDFRGAGQVADLWIMEVGGVSYLFYTASSDGSAKTGNMHIKLATANMPLAQLIHTQEGA